MAFLKRVGDIVLGAQPDGWSAASRGLYELAGVLGDLFDVIGDGVVTRKAVPARCPLPLRIAGHLLDALASEGAAGNRRRPTACRGWCLAPVESTSLACRPGP